MGNGQMGRDSRRLREEIIAAGAVAVGITRLHPVPDAVMDTWREWIFSGRNAGMEYMDRHEEIRRNPELLLDGAISIICVAFTYRLPKEAEPISPCKVARYAMLPDYHDWVRDLLRNSGALDILGDEHTDWRICVDSAPIFERYWAQESGIGQIGENGMLIVPGAGSEVILAEIITNCELTPYGASFSCGNQGLSAISSPIETRCSSCGACRGVCPAGALGEGGIIDARACLSYLTIEHKGEIKEKASLEAMATGGAKETIFGCDRCVRVCPRNRLTNSGNYIERQNCFSPVDPHPGIRGLEKEDFRSMTNEEFNARFKGSPLKRAKKQLLGAQATNPATEENEKVRE